MRGRPTPAGPPTPRARLYLSPPSFSLSETLCEANGGRVGDMTQAEANELNAKARSKRVGRRQRKTSESTVFGTLISEMSKRESVRPLT